LNETPIIIQTITACKKIAIICVTLSSFKYGNREDETAQFA